MILKPTCAVSPLQRWFVFIPLTSLCSTSHDLDGMLFESWQLSWPYGRLGVRLDLTTRPSSTTFDWYAEDLQVAYLHIVHEIFLLHFRLVDTSPIHALPDFVDAQHCHQVEEMH
eukprot:2344461-Amphidinium_carterae.1